MMHIVLHFRFLSHLLFKLFVLWNSSLSFAIYIFFFFSFAEPNIEVSGQFFVHERCEQKFVWDAEK